MKYNELDQMKLLVILAPQAFCFAGYLYLITVFTQYWSELSEVVRCAGVIATGTQCPIFLA